MLKSIVTAVRDALAWITDLAAQVLNELPAPENSRSPLTGAAAESAMDYFARRATAVVLFTAALLLTYLPAYVPISPSLVGPVSDFMQRVATWLLN